jgi:hypothetical protein
MDEFILQNADHSGLSSPQKKMELKKNAFIDKGIKMRFSGT